jgi:predicted Rossmann-fold nucleotide-binding protein
MHIQLNPVGNMNLLSQSEVDQLQHSANSKLHTLYRNCSLAVLNAGSNTDNAEDIYKQYKDFNISVMREQRGVKLDLKNPPKHAFVDGKVIRGIKEHLSAVLRDILFLHNPNKYATAEGITDTTFEILRNANVVLPESKEGLITCWGGHSINAQEYKYTKKVGYQLGLRKFNICTGCGPGAMKGPMKGATIGHAKQRSKSGRYIGLTEPGIIAAEPPNAIVNELVILPDIEKRLEAFIRLSHGIIIFPGGAGTAEELLYVLGILLNDKNKKQKLPIILTGPKSSLNYFKEIDLFIAKTLGKKAQNLYEIIIDDSVLVAQKMRVGLKDVLDYRASVNDSFHFNWSLEIHSDFQHPFDPTHKNIASLQLNDALSSAELAANLRRIFSAIVSGNVKDSGIKAIKEHGKFEISGDKKMMVLIDKLLSSYVEQQRMKLPGSEYIPCYKIIND